jgi:hypothetical protein
LIDLSPGREAFGKHRVRYVLHGEWAEQLYFALRSCRLDDIHLYLLEPILCQQRWPAWPDVRITTSALHCLSVKLDVASERGTIWIAEVAAKVGIRNDQDSSWAEHPPDLSQRLNRVRQV